MYNLGYKHIHSVLMSHSHYNVNKAGIYYINWSEYKKTQGCCFVFIKTVMNTSGSQTEYKFLRFHYLLQVINTFFIFLYQ